MHEIFSYIKKYRYWIIAIILLVAAIYSIVHSFVRPTTAKPTPTPTASTAPVSTESPLISVTDRPNPTPTDSGLTQNHLRFADFDAANDTIYYYNLDSNEVTKTNINSQQSTVLGTLSAYVNDLKWAPNHTKILITAENSQGSVVTNPIYQEDINDGETFVALFDLSTSKLTVLDRHIVSASFINNDQIVYEYKDNTQHNLAIAKPDGSNWKNIVTLTDQVSLVRAGETALISPVDGKALRIDSTGKTIDTYILPEELELDQSAWAPNGEAVFYTIKDGTVTIKHFHGASIDTVATLSNPGGEMTIMWDNSKGKIYLATETGLMDAGTIQ